MLLPYREERRRRLTFSNYKDRTQISSEEQCGKSETRLEENDDLLEIEDENGCWMPVPDASIPGGWHYLPAHKHDYV